MIQGLKFVLNAVSMLAVVHSSSWAESENKEDQNADVQQDEVKQQIVQPEVGGAIEGVEAFRKENFGGDKVILEQGIYELADFPEVQSIKVPQGYEILLSDSADFQSANNASYPDVERENSSEIANIDRGKFRYLYIAKLDPKQESGISAFTKFDKRAAAYIVRGQEKITDFGNPDDVREVVIESSPKLESFPNLEKYKNLNKIKFILDSLTQSKPEVLSNIMQEIVTFMQNVHPIKSLEFQGLGAKTILFPNIFVGINLKTDDELIKNTSIKELYLIDCDIKQIPDFSKFWNLKRIYLYGSTFKQADEGMWSKFLQDCGKLGITHLILPDGFRAPLDAKDWKESKAEYLAASGVKDVAKEAFKSNAFLKEIHCDSVENIGADAFRDTVKLQVADFPGAVVIQKGAFCDTAALQSVNVPSVRTIEDEAFKNLPRHKVQIGVVLDGAKTLKLKAGAGFLYLPECETVGVAAFQGNEVKRPGIECVLLPKCVKIAAHAFQDLLELRKVQCSSVKTIGSEAFKNCSALEKVEMLNVEEINGGAFRQCYALKDVGGAQKLYLPKLREVGAYAFYMDDKHPGQLKHLDLPSVILIGQEAFSRWRSVETVALPKCKMVDTAAFYDAYKLKKLELPVVETIGERAFVYNRQSLSGTLEFPRCKKIGKKAFGGNGWAYSMVSRVDINACTDCADDAFIGCRKLKTIKADKLSKGKRKNLLKKAKKQL